MRTVFFGSPAAALPSLNALIAAGHSVELVVTQPDRPAGRGRRPAPSAVKALALEHGLPVIEPTRIRTDEAALDRLRDAAPDVNVVVAYGQIIPRAIHYFPRFHSLNVHFSLLPKYRGAAPVQRAILSGDTESGVTIIELNDRMDEGDILASEKATIGPRETAGALEARLAVLGARLLLATLSGIDRIVPTAQDATLATTAPKVRKEEGFVSWAEKAEAVDRLILALAERPGVYSFLGGKRVNIRRGRPAEPRRAPAAPPSALPGTLLEIQKEGLLISCGGDTAFLIEELQPEGRAVMPAYAFSLGTRLVPGARFGEP
jgi:methionyl-tRNA formyltransferase